MEKQAEPLAAGRAGVRAREHPCPKCGYDLRAAAADGSGMVRCPECGTVARREELSQSHIPWVHRRKLGYVRAYFATLWMLSRRPGVLASEMSARQKRRDAESFHRVSVLLATVIGGALVGTAWACGHPEELPDAAFDHYWLMPACVLWDSWWGLIPLALGLWLGLRLTLAGYRWIGCIGVEGDFERRRARLLALYMSGFASVEALLGGWIAFSSVPFQTNGHPLLDNLLMGVGIGALVFAIPCGIGILFAAPILFIRRIGRKRIVRGALAILYPGVAAAMIFLSTAVCSWLAGYVAIAIRSSTR